jgi:hypothetical protein
VRRKREDYCPVAEDFGNIGCLFPPFFLEEVPRPSPHYRMTEITGKCLGIPIRISDDRKVVFCDELEFPCGWKEGDSYFLVKIEDGMICVGFVDGTTHEMNIEFRGSDPDKLIREVTRQDFVDKPHAAYIAAEIILAHQSLKTGTEYVQR